jgi:SAM-dependent methyltransferase
LVVDNAPTVLTFPQRFPPTDPDLQALFRTEHELPLGYGVGFDERVVELPWLFAQKLDGRMLDAGSTLNHQHVLDRLLPRIEALHIATLGPEPNAFTDRGISYLYEDLRDLPYRDGYFDTVATISTLEHVGMDNQRYGSTVSASSDPDREAVKALSELVRVLVPSGQLFLTVPYGASEDHGWFRQYDWQAARVLQETRGLELQNVCVYFYSVQGWQISDLEGARSAQYRDYHRDPSPVADLAAAARAVLCLRFIRSD